LTDHPTERGPEDFRNFISHKVIVEKSAIYIYIYDPVLSIVDGQIYFLIIPSLRTEEDVQPQLTRRRPGQSSLTTARNETDTVTILSGTERRSGDGGRLGEAGISWG
jgi:hypothetical protein